MLRLGCDEQKYEADPLDIPDLSSYLYSQLASLSADKDEDFSIRSTEPSNRYFPAPSEKMHPILPHIWDFEQVLVAERGRNLVRLMERLRRVDIIEPERDGGDGMPLGLRNQRRIWALVDGLLDTQAEQGKEGGESG